MEKAFVSFEVSMSRVIFLNGAFLPAEEAKVSVMDRGFLFSDGVYEGVGVLDGHLVDNDAHLERFERSMREIADRQSPFPRRVDASSKRNWCGGTAWRRVLLLSRLPAAWRSGISCFPKNVEPTIMMFTQAKSIAHAPAAEKGIAVITVPDQRWRRRDIKSIVAARSGSGKAGRERSRRAGGLDGRRRLRDRRRLIERLHRHANGQHRRAPALQRDPARDHPPVAFTAVAERRALCSKSGCSLSRRPMGQPRLFSPARRILCCLWSPSTAVLSAMGSRARSRKNCVISISQMARAPAIAAG